MVLKPLTDGIVMNCNQQQHFRELNLVATLVADGSPSGWQSAAKSSYVFISRHYSGTLPKHLKMDRGALSVR